MSTVILQKNFSTDALPDLVEPPRWPGMAQGNRNPPKISRPDRKSKAKTISEMSEAVNARRENRRLRQENLQLQPQREMSEMSRRTIHLHPPDVPFQEYKMKRNIRERPMSEIAIPPEWDRRKWDVAPIEGPFNIPELSKKRAKSSARISDTVIDVDVKDLTTNSLQPLKDTVRIKIEKEPLKLKSHPPPPEIFGPREPAPPPSRPPIRRKFRMFQRPKSAQLASDYLDIDVMEGICRPSTEMTSCRLEKYQMDIVAGAALSEPGWGDRTIDKRFLEEAATYLFNMERVKCFCSVCPCLLFFLDICKQFSCSV